MDALNDDMTLTERTPKFMRVPVSLTNKGRIFWCYNEKDYSF